MKKLISTSAAALLATVALGAVSVHAAEIKTVQGVTIQVPDNLTDKQIEAAAKPYGGVAGAEKETKKTTSVGKIDVQGATEEQLKELKAKHPDMFDDDKKTSPKQDKDTSAIGVDMEDGSTMLIEGLTPRQVAELLKKHGKEMGVAGSKDDKTPDKKVIPAATLTPAKKVVPAKTAVKPAPAKAATKKVATLPQTGMETSASLLGIGAALAAVGFVFAKGKEA